MAKATIYTGDNLDRVHKPYQDHPLTEVNKAKELIDKQESFIQYSNSLDFITTIFHYGKLKGFEIEFFINGISVKDNLEKVFEDFNRSFDLLDSIMND